MIKDIRTTPRHQYGIGKNHRAAPLEKNLRVFGCDTETVHGKPHTVQIFDGHDAKLFYVNGETIFWTFWDYVKERSAKKGVNLCYFHNLKFDLLILFHAYHQHIYEQYNDIKFRITDGDRNIDVKFIYGKVNAGEIKEGVTKVRLLDSRHFTQAGFDKSLAMFQIPYAKKKAPEGLGDKYLNDAEFEDYAVTDAVGEFHLAGKILEFHSRYKVSPSISLPQFAARVFRHHYFKPDTVIKFPPPMVQAASETSYHGGKNGFYLPGPCIKKNVWEVDINSSYPNAMRHLPQMTEGQFLEVDKYEPGYVGIYRVLGTANPKRKYPILFSPGFKRIDGAFQEEYVTSYEVEKMRGDPHYQFEIDRGFLWVPGKYRHNPFRKFVDEFYRLKETTPKEEKALYTFYKITLNALYGKFIAAVEKRDTFMSDVKSSNKASNVAPMGINMRWDEVLKKYIFCKTHYVASGMYNPFVGSLITGFARARLYEMETHYDALHSATDSVKTLQTPKEIKGLGGHKIECHGTCYFFRNKFYLHYADSFDFCGHKKSDAPRLGAQWGGEHLCKVALHGYKAKNDVGIKHLIDHRDAFLETHHLRYGYNHVVGLREGLKRGESPADFVKREEYVCLCNDKSVPCVETRGQCHCIFNVTNS